jgi:hypothetical protein
LSAGLLPATVPLSPSLKALALSHSPYARRPHWLRLQSSRCRPRSTDRFKHLAVFGKPGLGKSTLLPNMIAADLIYGAGLTAIDLHGRLIADILEIILSNAAYALLSQR